MFLTQHKFSILNSKKVLCCIEIGGKSSLPKLLFKKQTIYYSILCYFFLMFIAPLIHIYVYIHTHKSVANLMLAKGEKTQNQKYSGEKSKKKKKTQGGSMRHKSFIISIVPSREHQKQPITVD